MSLRILSSGSGSSSGNRSVALSVRYFSRPFASPDGYMPMCVVWIAK